MDTIAAFWESYRREVLPADAPDIQVQECRRAFYAGAKAVVAIVTEIGDDSVTEDQGLDILTGLHEECRTFVADVMRGRA